MRLVVGKQDAAHVWSPTVRRKHVGHPVRLASATVPPCASMIQATMAWPRPVPEGRRDTNGRDTASADRFQHSDPESRQAKISLLASLDMSLAVPISPRE